MTITVATTAFFCGGEDWLSCDSQRVPSSVSVRREKTKPKRRHLHHILDTPVGKRTQLEGDRGKELGRDEMAVAEAQDAVAAAGKFQIMGDQNARQGVLAV